MDSQARETTPSHPYYSHTKYPLKYGNGMGSAEKEGGPTIRGPWRNPPPKNIKLKPRHVWWLPRPQEGNLQ